MDAHLSDPSPPLGADAEPTGPRPQPPASEPPRDEDEDEAEPSPTEDGAVAAAPLLPEAGGGTPPEAGSQEETPWEHTDGKRPQSCEERPAQPEGPAELSGQEFTFLEVSGWGEAADPPLVAALIQVCCGHWAALRCRVTAALGGHKAPWDG